jgi:hypothetical protein
MEEGVRLSLGKTKQERNSSNEVCGYRLSQALQRGVRRRLCVAIAAANYWNSRAMNMGLTKR